MSTPYFTFGVEIEVRAEPHKIREPLQEKHALYYDKLAAALRNRNLKAKANDLQSTAYRSKNYNEWWITRDSSLGRPSSEDKMIPMEAVSPILDTRMDWGAEIDTFWSAMRAVFHMPERSERCGSHVHVSKGRGKNFTLSELKTIAYGIVVYESLVTELLMSYRKGNPYCKANTLSSGHLRQVSGNPQKLVTLINGASDAAALKDIMQESRYVLWNFENILPGKSGTIEFRGGRFLRGEVRTKRWMAFAVAFIHAMLQLNDLGNPSPNGRRALTAAALYGEIKKAADQLNMGQYLPSNYRVLNETQGS